MPELNDIYGYALTVPQGEENSLAPPASIALDSRLDGVTLLGITGFHAAANGFYARGADYDGNPAFYGPEGANTYAIIRFGGSYKYALYTADNIVIDADAELWFLGSQAAGPITAALLDVLPGMTITREGILPDTATMAASAAQSFADLPAASTLPPGDENGLGGFFPIEEPQAPEQPVVIPHTSAIESGVHTRVFVQYRSNSVDINLAADPTEDQWVEIIDGSLQADVYPITVDPQGYYIEGDSNPYVMNTPGAVLELFHRAGNWKIL